MKAIEIFGEAKQPTPANNPVAKNANKAIGGGASGTHKNSKRAESIPRKEKHKKAPELAEATNRHFGPKGAGTELARQTRANGELDRNKQPELSGIPKKNEFNVTEPKTKIQVKKNKGVAEAKRADRPLPKTDLQVGDRVVADLRKEKDYPGGHQFRSGFVTRIGEKGVHIEPDDRGPNEWHPYKIVKKLGEGKSAREKWTAASNAREKAHNEREAEQAKLPAEKRLGSAVDALKKHLDSKVTEEQFCEDCGGSLAEHGKASRALCISSKPDSELGASNLASCKSQGLRAREGKKSHKLGKSPKSRVKVGGHKIKGKEYGGPLPDWS
jgi:hypothetical protein